MRRQLVHGVGLAYAPGPRIAVRVHLERRYAVDTLDVAGRTLGEEDFAGLSLAFQLASASHE